VEKRLIENFQIVIDESRAQTHSAAWRGAVKDLARVHADLPDVASLAAQHLPQTSNQALASRLSNVAIREVSSFGRDRLTDDHLKLAVRRTHRSVLIQEASEQMMKDISTPRTASDFLSLKRATSNPDKTGLVAIAALERQGIDARKLLRGMSERELKAVSVGAYDRVEGVNRDRLASALEITTASEGIARTEMTRGPLPVVRPARTQMAPLTRQKSFGRRMALAEQMMRAQSASY